MWRVSSSPDAERWFLLVTSTAFWRIEGMNFNTLKIGAVAFLLASPMAAVAQENQLTAKEKEDGWKLLFDGKSFQGWRNYKSKEVRKEWKIVDGSMQVSRGAGDIITADQYEDYELSLQWKIAEGANSGIFIGAQETGGAIYESAVEMQVLDNERHPDAKHEKHVSGSCYGLYKPPAGAAKKAGEWNQVRIIKKGGHVQFILNGVTTADFDMDSVDFINRIQNSKFKQWTHFARYRKGHIGFQDHGDVVWFRNIKIKPAK